MKILRISIVVFMSVWMLAALGYSLVTMFWTQATMLRLQTPEFQAYGEYTDTASIEIYAADGTRMYREDFRFGGRLTEEDDLSIPIYLLNAARETQAPYKERFSLWQRALFRMEGLQPDSLESFIHEYYANSITAVSSLEDFQKKLLQYNVMKKLQGTYTDRELYTMFLDSAYYASNIQGICGAAKAYFNKSYSELNLLELAFLMAKATNKPSENVQYHDRIARSYLSLFYQNSMINSAEYRRLLDSKLLFQETEFEVIEPVLIDYALEELGKYSLEKDSAEIKITTHDKGQAPEGAKTALQSIYEKDPRLQAAFVMLNAESGGIEVILGSRVENSHRNRALSFKRQMGSSFKPVVYATALQQGMLPCEHIVDKQYTFKSGKTVYSPGNYRNVFLGSIPMRFGLVYSLNNATVSLAQKAGLSRISKNAVAMGFEGDISPYYSLALGAYGTTPLSVAKMYGTLANFGESKDFSLLKDVSINGEQQFPAEYESKRIFDEVTAYQTLYMMQDVCIKGTARNAKMLPGTAAKTGTTDHSKDLWTVAISYPYVIVLWIGYDDYSAMHEDLSGGNLAAPVIAAFQKEYFGADAAFTIPVPDGIQFAEVRTATGLLVDKKSKNKGPTYIEAFREGYLPEKEK